jgi:hypothetical protein
MSNRMADMQLDIGAQALAILAMLSQCEPAFEQSPADVDSELVVSSHAFYNGRERAVVVSYQRGFMGKCLNIVFGEGRNSDSIFIDWWVTERALMNGPRVADFPEEAYRDRKYHDYGRLDVAVQHIYDLVEDFYIVGAVDFCSKHDRRIDEKERADNDPLLSEDWQELKGAEPTPKAARRGRK